MNFKKKLLLGSSILAFISPVALASAQEAETTWQARTVEEVLAEIIVNSDNQVSYTVKFGDTLSVISEAMKIEEQILADINKIENVDLIFPETILTAQYDANERVESLTVESPDGEVLEVDIPVNLSVFPEIEESAPEVEMEEPVAETTVETIEVEETEAPTTPENPASIESTLPTLTGSEAAGQEQLAPAIVEVPTWIEAETEVELVEEAVVSEPVYEEVIVEDTVIVEPEVEQIVVEEPIIEEVVVEEPVLEETIVEEVVVEEPIIEEPIVEEPVIEQPVVEEVPVYEEEVAEIPEEIYEEIQVDEVIYEEDIVTEDPAVVEEIVSEPNTPEFDPMANPENNGLQPHAAAYKEEVANIYGIDSFSLNRPGDAGDHGNGLAVDFMVPVGSDLGDDVANYSVNNMAENNISYVIWEQQIYGDWNNQWTAMEDRGNLTANHYDHVHVSFNPY